MLKYEFYPDSSYGVLMFACELTRHTNMYVLPVYEFYVLFNLKANAFFFS